MKRKWYFVLPKNRVDFYNYMSNLGYRFKDSIINSKFPFYVDLEKREVIVIESITICACAAHYKQILSFEEFKGI